MVNRTLGGWVQEILSRTRADHALSLKLQARWLELAAEAMKDDPQLAVHDQLNEDALAQLILVAVLEVVWLPTEAAEA